MRTCCLVLYVAALGCGEAHDAGDSDAAVGDAGNADAMDSDAAVGDAGADAAPGATFTVNLTVTGFGGAGLVLRLNGSNDLAITGDGAFSFPSMLADGASYEVAVAAEPTCPQRLCALAGATGAISGANASVTVTCAVPVYRLFSHNWGSPQGIRVTDDVLALADNATATPRIVTGGSTGVGSATPDSIAVDRARDLVYAPALNASPDPSILVFANASTMTGDVAPARQFVVVGGSELQGVELDEEADRLYVSGQSGTLYIFDGASTLTGTVTPTAQIALASPGAISLDRETDRLYVAATVRSLYVFDGARALTSASTATRTMTWNTPAAVSFSLAIDGCRDRVYLSIRNVDTGVNVFALDNASTLTGVVDLQASSQAKLTVPDDQVMSTALDGFGNLYLWKDSATAVHIVSAPDLLSGTVVVAPTTINAVVDSGYGLDVMAYIP
jgi:hypothetical protein